MKKALSIVLALLVAFSMFGVMAFATTGETTEAEPPITVIFKVDGEVYRELKVNSGDFITLYIKEYPAKEETDTTRYTFEGWMTEGDETLYKGYSALPAPTLAEGETTKTIVYEAVFYEEDLSERQSFLNFIEILFERLNTLFEYFATIFNF